MGKHIGILALAGAAIIFLNAIRLKNLVKKHSFAIVFLFLILLLPQVIVADSETPPDPTTDQTSFEDMGSGFLPGDEHLELFRRLVEMETPREETFLDFTSQLPDPGSDLDMTWTFLFYDDAEFVGYNPFSDFCSRAHSSENLTVIVLQDTETGPTTLWYVHEDSYPIFLANWGEMNMGDWATLYDFIVWGKANYPADRYMLAMYDHGGGWMGACVDITSGDMLSMDEIGNAIREAGGVDILAFTAPCLMGALESVYELQDCVDVYIGSEELSGFAFWKETIDDICDILDDSSTLSNAEIGSMIIDLIETNAPPQYEEWLTMSAIDQDFIQNITDPLDELSEYSIENMSELGPNIQTARHNAWCMGMDGTYTFYETDLYDYLLQISEVETDAFVLDKSLEIRQAFTTAIINECHGSGQDRTHGLTIYFPPVEGSFNTQYGNVNLDFADNTQWNEFLAAYYDWQQTGIAGGPAVCNPGISVNPSPFSNTTLVTYTCPSSEIIDLTVFDISGRAVRTLTYGMVESGTHNIIWDGRNHLGSLVPAGVYICVLKTENGSMCSTMVILVR